MSDKKKKHINRKPSVSVSVKRPKGTRKTFALIKVEVKKDGTRDQTIIKSKQLDTYNSDYRANPGRYNEINRQVELLRDKIRDELREKMGLTSSSKSLAINSGNRRLVARFFDEIHSAKPFLKDITREKAKGEMDAVLSIFQSIPLSTISKKDLDKKYWFEEDKYSDETKNRMVCRVNSLLKLSGNDVRLTKKPLDEKIIRFLKEEELEAFVACLSRDIDKIAARIYFYTGLRTGELFGLEKRKIIFDQRIIKVDKQYTREGELTVPKSRKTRVAIFPTFLTGDLDRWFEIPKKTRIENRDSMGRRFLDTSRRIWGEHEIKNISPHDLRRSFAIHHIEVNKLSLTEVALLLGDTMSVVQRYYSGFAFTEDAATELARRLG